MKTFNLVCGGSHATAPVAGEPLIRLDVQGAARNVNLRIADISRAMLSSVPGITGNYWPSWWHGKLLVFEAR